MSATDILPTYCSDHTPITLDLVIWDSTSGKGYWKFPEFLLSDAEYASVLKSTIDFSLKDNAGVEPGLLWDMVKTSIRGSTIDYLFRAKKQCK